MSLWIGNLPEVWITWTQILVKTLRLCQCCIKNVSYSCSLFLSSFLFQTPTHTTQSLPHDEWLERQFCSVFRSKLPLNFMSKHGGISSNGVIMCWSQIWKLGSFASSLGPCTIGASNFFPDFVFALVFIFFCGVSFPSSWNLNIHWPLNLFGKPIQKMIRLDLSLLVNLKVLCL